MYSFERILSRKTKKLYTHLVSQALRGRPHDAHMRSMQRDKGLVLISGITAENHSEWNLLYLAALGAPEAHSQSLMNAAN